ncbi:protein timeless [Dorcoceras hygrometricum]|uniref:Protein timeless n=1 Tax=Dorcoceras hygrometricum TaxID=472368 RepID=A0A2Z7BND5_9LAMI|nr:protein timeless [Dorcoceras hygrometricum]
MDGLSSICAGIGTLEEDENGNRIGYEKGEYCSDNLKDLLRFLRRDDPEKRDVFKQVCKWNIVGKDLIPIIEYCQDDRNLMLNAVKILVFLTMPVEPTSTDVPEQIDYLWGLKSAITNSYTVPVVVSVLESPLHNLENESFTEDDWKLVQLVLTLVRNILAVQDISTQHRAAGFASQFLSLRDKFLELLFKENVMDMIIAFSQHTGGSHCYLRQDNLLLLEILYYIFNGQEPELIAKIHCKESKVEEEDENSMTSLHSIMKEEQEKRKLTRLRNLSCYSQFTGTYTRVTLDGSKALFKGNPCSVSGDVLRKAQKIQRVLMQSIREDIEKEHQEIQSSDLVVFFHVAQFVSSFQYYKSLTSKSSNAADKEVQKTTHDDVTLFDGCVCRPVSQTLNESMFLLVISKWRYAFEGLKQTNDYKLLSAAGSLVKTMIRMLDLVLKESPQDSDEPRTARALLYKLFYDQTEEGMTHFLLNLIKSFDTHKQSKRDLANLVETMHVIIRLMENLQARGSIRVSKKTRKKKTKKTITKKETAHESSFDDAATRNEVGTFTCEPFDDAKLSQKETVTTLDFDKGPNERVRDSDEVNEPASKPTDLGSTQSGIEDRVVGDNNDDLYLGTDDSSDDEQLVLTDEVDLKVSSLVSALANNSIVWKLCWLLKFYRSNPTSTNHFVLSILRRICDDLELSPMLYQLSLLTIFYEILEEQKLKPCKEYENIVTFLTSFIRRMLRKIKNYPLLLVEVLFWKTRKECHYISCGSILKELNSMRNNNGEAGSGTMDGGNHFVEGQKWVRRNIADALGDDEFEEMHHEFQEEDNSSQPPIFQLIRQSSGELKNSVNSIVGKGILAGEISDREEHFGGEELDRMPKGGYPGFSDELQGKVTDLYEKFKDNSDCCQLIAGELDPTGNVSAMRISETLKQLGFKVPAKKKMQNSGALNKLKHGSSRDRPRNAMQPNLSVINKNSSLRKPIHSRKRVQAFSVDQEQMIKELFEKFKDHRRCSYMIANELDGTGNISAAQVSRKLKQLGLVLHKTKKNDANFHLRDESSKLDMSSKSEGESDDETLLSLRKRSKHKPNGNHSEMKKQKIVQKSSEGMMDDESLISILVYESVPPSHLLRTLMLLHFKKNKKVSSESEEELMADTTKTNADQNNSQFRDIQVSERDEIDSKNINPTDINYSSDSESETMRLDTLNTSEIKSFENPDTSQDPLFDDQLSDELVDFDENTDSIGTPQNSVVRRRARMVIDFEDD